MENEQITIEQGVVGMNEQIEFEYYYGEEAEQFNFLMMPRFLIKEKRFSQLSDTSKILYSLMLERMSLSRKNNWFDDQDRPYIYYSVDCAKQETGRSKPTVIKAMKEIEEIGLIERKKQGQGKPTIVYVKKFVSKKKPVNPDTEPEVKNLDFKKSTPLTSRSQDAELQEVKDADFKRSTGFTSRGKGSGLQEVNELAPNYTENSYTEDSNTEHSQIEKSYTEVRHSCPVLSASAVDNSYDEDDDDEWMEHIDYSKPFRVTAQEPQDRRTERDEYIDLLKYQVQYDRLCMEDEYHDQKNIIDGIINIIADIATTVPPDGYERINGREYPHEVVSSRLTKMDYETITHVLSRFKENKTEIRNMRSYLLTALYNARDEKDIQFQNFFNHTYYNTDWTKQRRENESDDYICGEIS